MFVFPCELDVLGVRIDQPFEVGALDDLALPAHIPDEPLGYQCRDAGFTAPWIPVQVDAWVWA